MICTAHVNYTASRIRIESQVCHASVKTKELRDTIKYYRVRYSETYHSLNVNSISVYVRFIDYQGEYQEE